MTPKVTSSKVDTHKSPDLVSGSFLSFCLKYFSKKRLLEIFCYCLFVSLHCSKIFGKTLEAWLPQSTYHNNGREGKIRGENKTELVKLFMIMHIRNICNELPFFWQKKTRFAVVKAAFYASKHHYVFFKMLDFPFVYPLCVLKMPFFSFFRLGGLERLLDNLNYELKCNKRIYRERERKQKNNCF